MRWRGSGAPCLGLTLEMSVSHGQTWIRCDFQGLPGLVNIQKSMENHHFQWENPLFLWSFSIAMLVYQRVCLIYQRIRCVFFSIMRYSNVRINIQIIFWMWIYIYILKCDIFMILIVLWYMLILWSGYTMIYIYIIMICDIFWWYYTWINK
jgi:hypothetical protein